MNICAKISAKLRAILFYKNSFKQYGRKSMILRPLQIDGMENISIGNHVVIGEDTWLAAMPLTNTEHPHLVIGDNCVLGHFNHIYATSQIIIEDAVLTADKVYISDNLHTYDDLSKPILKQPIRQLKPVRIGEGSWLGENVCVLGGSIGKHCVIGANAVVTKDIPDYSVAVGVPARVIKRYDAQAGKWLIV